MLLWECAPKETLPDSRALVETPEKRAAYLTTMLDEICVKLGPRPCGSPDYLASTQIMLREFAKAAPRTMLDEFTFERWILTGEPVFTINDEPVETYPGHGSLGTPPEGLTGVLEPCDMEKIPYRIIDPKMATVFAYITGGYEKAVPLPYYMHKQPVKCPPTFNIGSIDFPRLERAAATKKPVFVRSEVEFVPDTKTANVAATIPGKSPEEIVLIAHLDTVYNTVGANDNTASVIVMLMLAHAFSGTLPKKTLTFIANDGEEYDKIGAINYAERRKREGTFGAIRYLLNFDSLTWGTDVIVQTKDSGLRDIIASIDTDLGLEGTPELKDGDGFALDGRPFRDDAIRAMYVNSIGGSNIGVWHRPEDTPGLVDASYAEIGFRLFHEYIRRLMDT